MLYDDVYKSYLAHYGILGMKWGFRRFQNEDGSLTEAGRARYGSDVTNVSGEKLRKQANKLIYYQATHKSDNKKKSERQKTYEKWDKAATKFSKKYDKTNMSPDQAMQYLEASEAFTQAFFQEAAGAILRDLGYEDTQAGRNYVRRFLDTY